MKNRKPREDGRYIVNVSFTTKETSLLAWADRQGNFSTYVKKLIEQDMKKESTQDSEFIQMLMNYMGKDKLKDIFQNEAMKEVTVEQDKTPTVNKSKIKNILNKK